MRVLLCALCVVTVYAEPYVGRERYCGGMYDLAESEPWIALPVEWYEQDQAECGDLFYLAGVDAEGASWSLMARARDAGPLSRYCVELDEVPALSLPKGCARIVADVPTHQAPFPGLSARVERWVNISAQARAVGNPMMVGFSLETP